MKIILWALTALLTTIPLVTYVVYSMRRLGTRRRLLRQTLHLLGLDDAYMRIRHGEHYCEWRALAPDKRTEELESVYFNKDFKAETSPEDYLWPVLLITALSAVGWYCVLSRLYPEAGIAQLKEVPLTFLWGFVGTFFASLLTIFDDFRKYSLTPSSFYSLVFRLLFSSTAAFLAAQLFKDSFSPLVAFGIGLFPVEKTWEFITERTSQALNVTKGKEGKENELGEDLAHIQGLEDSRNRKKLIDAGITSVQALATADPLLLFLQTTFPMRTVIDMIDKAILYLYIGDKVKELRVHGINGVIELCALVKLIEKRPAYGGAGGMLVGDKAFSKFFEDVDPGHLISSVAKVLGQSENELKAFIYNMYYDPVVDLIYTIWGHYEPAGEPRAKPAGEPRADERADQRPPRPVESPPQVLG